ncbi:hypothetical protein M138_4732, partial [Bacteroides fragilis str. S23L17]
ISGILSLLCRVLILFITNEINVANKLINIGIKIDKNRVKIPNIAFVSL